MDAIGLTLVFILHWQRRNEPNRRRFLRGSILPAMRRAKGP